MKPTLLILAAGIGSRYGGLKQLDGFWPAGETILEYSVYDAIRAGFGKVVFVIRPDFEQAFREKIGSRFEGNIDVSYVYQELTSCVPNWFSTNHREKPRGTGHAVLVAKDEITTPFAVINADDYYGISWYTSITDYLTHHITPTKCAMVWYVLKNTLSENGKVNRWICEADDDDHLISVNERHSLERRDDGNVRDMHDRMIDEDSIVSMNFWWFDASIFAIIQTLFEEFLEKRGDDPTYEFYIPSVVNNFIRAGNTCKVIPCDAQWCGVTYPEDKEHTRSLLSSLTKANTYPTPLQLNISYNTI
jgi:dTDP-glucose pyrophosphorylase